jgi:hypothetical protein
MRQEKKRELDRRLFFGSAFTAKNHFKQPEWCGREIWSQFHQRFTYNFYACRSQKCRKIQLSHKYLFTLSGSVSVKAARRTLMKLSPHRLFFYSLSLSLACAFTEVCVCVCVRACICYKGVHFYRKTPKTRKKREREGSKRDFSSKSADISC